MSERKPISQAVSVGNISLKIVLTLSTFLILAFWSMFFQAYGFWDGDYEAHTSFAIQIRETGQSSVPHFLYHIIMLAFKELIPWLSYQVISSTILVMVMLLLGLMVFALLHQAAEGRISDIWLAVITFCLLIITPVFVAIPTSMKLLGFINPTIYHNPTQNLLKLFVIPASLFALRGINPTPYRNLNQRLFLALTALLVGLLVSLAKPNYVVALLPVILMYGCYRLIQRQRLDWLLLLAICGPAIMTLLLQFILAYGTDDSASIVFGPFVVFRSWVQPHYFIALGLLQSIMFPLSVYALYFREARKNTYLNMSWLIFGFGLILAYGFHESGNRWFHGNLVWSAYIALFVLFYASVVFLVRRYQPRSTRSRTPIAGYTEHETGGAVVSSPTIPFKLKVIGMIFILHAISGIRYAASLQTLYAQPS